MKHQKNEEFEKTGVLVPNSGPPGALLITCCRCGAQERLSLGNLGRIAPDRAALKFETRGWDCSNGRRSRDVCPACSKPARPVDAPQPEVELEPIAPPPPVAPVIAPEREKLAEMSREERRIIFAKLNDVYVDEASGYSNGWGDQRVATDLSVPRAWVQAVREQNFGPDPTNEETRAQLDEARGLLTETRETLSKMRVDYDTAMQAIERVRNYGEAVIALGGKADVIEKAMARIAKAVGG